MSYVNDPRRIYVKTCRRDVTTAGTPERLFPGNPAYYECLSITIRADADNVGNIYLGGTNRVSDTDYSFIIAPGETKDLIGGQDENRQDRYINAARMWIDCDNDGESLSFLALMDREPW